MRDGVLSGLNVTDQERKVASNNIDVVQENSRVAEEFFKETVKPMLEMVKPDLLWIDPALAYLGGESNSQAEVGKFLRNQLNPLAIAFNCGVIVVHHTNKPNTGPERRVAVDAAYLGGGSQTGTFMIMGPGRATPILMCKQGADRLQLDLDIAASDARYWWEHGKVPLRETPRNNSAPIVKSLEQICLGILTFFIAL